MRRIIAFALLLLPSTARGQQAEHTISPGMTRAQVVAALGAPTTQRTASEFTYMFYPNACGRACGMNDLVILKHDSVTDAIFRSPNRHYTGTSSSPEQTPPAAKSTAPLRIKPPAKPTDATPSIPVKSTPMPPAPARTTAPDKKTPG